MFFRKKATPEERSAQVLDIAKGVLGPDARGELEASFPTAQRYPFLADRGANALCRYYVEGRWRGRALSLAMPLQLYDSERDRKWSHFSFTGLCLQLMDPAWLGGEAYLFSGRPFRPPEGDKWVENPPIGRRPLWSAGGPISPAWRAGAERLTGWLEGQAAAAISARYGLYLGDGAASMVFWEPQCYDLEGELRILTELLDKL